MITACDIKRLMAAPFAASALSAFALAPAHARDAKELMMKAVGTTENVSPVIFEAIT